ncbi:four-carbon acid sugar kinase family protein [Clostridium formicaceticum]|uniref:Serine kinase n=1 Tax=Clostridium formicaceticum TaxID=1497 RepID=A0AAC9RJW9_9CLOT|nr:four-carbon acid sugar kinase family protein [Clostridium formicaceticum]AOY76286.1 serine kinase [Clostridium formicaceticum]ARE86673.1 hypothetical protein CLFO_09990 [Clostridium formicaceticum]
MSKIIVIADDLTGANATGVLLARRGFKSATYLNLKNFSEENNFDAISISTDSRGVDRALAYRRVTEVLKVFKDKNIRMFSKRIDSTLRGNIGAEIDAVLDTLDNEEIAIVVASFPSSGRIAVGGYLMVNAIPLEKTDVAKDPKTPVDTSCIIELISKQTKYKVGFIPLKEVLKGIGSLKERILQEKQNGKRVVIVDATTDEEIEIIARAVAAAELPAVAADPGPFTAALAKNLVGQSSVVPGKKVMFAVGSVTNNTKRQLDELKLKYTPLIIKADPEALIHSEKMEEEIHRVASTLLSRMNQYEVLGVTTNGSKILNLKEISRKLNISEDDVSQRIADGLAKITENTMRLSKGLIGALYTSGGDITVAVCKELKSSGIEVKDEVLPLAAYGRIIDGAYNNTPIITKGGLVGGDSAMTDCIEYLRTKVSNEYHINLD